ncbi:MAG: response regulator [Candidatus Omnitrophica bacterium]|jgi:DNA-binding response OmpR family regulator|nr:response regulator [Candidatus Omnitrophota bacterium]
MNKKIMVVDDEVDVQKVLKARFESEGFSVDVASDGQEAWNKIQRQKPDLIILDHIMPVMDGFTLFKKIRQDLATRGIKVVMLTAKNRMKDTFEVFGVDDFLDKPCDAGMLVNRVTSLLQTKALVLTDNTSLVDRVSLALHKYNYVISPVNEERLFWEEVNKFKYNLLIVHLNLVTQDAGQFMLALKKSKNQDTSILLYSDANFDDSGIHQKRDIGRIKDTWLNAQATMFFDARISEQSFQQELDILVKSA